ncbi:DMT family transporter [Candidatus Parcubacteria bacterium]|jgi:drug/metabolite transporter (DMT)-like permease|nr:DMT family transporter [Candidatus Parcubacteria bacterium]
MSWLLVAVIAYSILAVVNVADKFMLEKVIPAAKTYAFLVGVTGLLVFVVAPWFLEWPGFNLFLLNIITGVFFAGGLLFLYTALRDAEVTKIFTLTGGAVPVFIIWLSIIFFHERFSPWQWLAVCFLIAGTVMISWVSGEHGVWTRIKEWLHIKHDKKIRSILFAVLAAACFAIFWVGTKYAYNTQAFVSAFLWIRLGTFLAVILMLVNGNSRREIFDDLQQSNTNKDNKFIFMGVQGLGAIGSVLQNYAVSLGSVALVTSLQGLQYALLLVMSAIVTAFLPNIIKEYNPRRIIIQKIVAVLIIGLGLYFLAIY